MSWILIVARRFLFGPTLHLWRQPVGFICILSIALAMAATLVTQSVIRGFEGIYEKSILAFNAHLVITPWDSSLVVSSSLPHLDELVRSGTAESYSPFSVIEALALSPGNTAGVVIKGVQTASLEKTYHLQIQHFPDTGSNLVPVYVGKQLYEQSGSPKTLSLMLAGNEESYQRTEKVFIAGIFESGMYEFDAQFILADQLDLASLAGKPVSPIGYEVSLTRPAQAVSIAHQLEDSIGEHYQIVPWQELNAPLFEAMKLERTVFLIILFLVLLIASFGLVGMMLMILWKRRSDLVILHAMGATRPRLILLCAAQGLYQSFLGLVFGSVLAGLFLAGLRHFWIALDPKIYFIDRLPVAWDFLWWSYLWLGALALCFVSSLVAARMALKNGVPVRGAYG